MTRYAILIAGLALTLSACGDSPEEISRKRDAACREWGAKPGSAEYIQCRATLEANAIRKRRQDDSDALALSVMSAGLAAGAAARR